jgi:hypothetical protein
MTFPVDYKAAVLKYSLAAAMGMVLLTLIGCSSSQSGSARQGFSDQAATEGAGPKIDTGCVSDHIDNPSEAFHYSFKKVEGANFREEEADITPQTIDGTLTTGNGKPYSFHGARSDSTSWDGAELNLTGAVGMLTASATILSGSSALAREGTEKLNGYDTTKYSIDTARGSAHEKGGYELVLGPGGSAKGMVWITTQGCPAKLLLDEEVHQMNGGVNKLHYEMAMVRK